MKKNILILLGVMFVLAACGKEQIAETAVQEPVTTTEETVSEVTAESEASGENIDEQVDYVEDTVLSTDLFTLTLPDEFKGKTRAIIDGEFISVFDKESNEAGYGGHAFSVVVDKDKDIIPGGMFTKVGELETAEGDRYDVCVGYPSDIQWDYTKYEKEPEDYANLYSSAEQIVQNIQANNGGVFIYGAGTKGEELYAYTVSRYIDAFNEGWDANRFEDEGMSPEFYALMQAEGDKALDKIGFAYKDISYDGVDELLVGVIGDDEPSIVYDIYTVVDKVPTLVVSGTSRNRYYGLEYGDIANAFSGGADENGIHVFLIEPGTANLYHQYSVKYDAYTDEKNPWFVNYEDDDESWEKITEEEYNEKLERITESFLKLDYTPLSEIAPIDYSKVDLSKYSSFTKMLDDFKKGMAYANEKVGDIDVFLVSSFAYGPDSYNQNAIDASVFIYDDKEGIVYLGKIESSGTAYPIAIADGYLYTAGHHYVTKTTIKDGKLISEEKSEDAYDEYAAAEPVVFSVEKP